MEQLNLCLIGAVVGGIIGSCFSINAVKDKSNKAEEKVRAYEQYYKCTETLLDSLNGTHDLDLMDTDLETDYGVDYLEAKSKVDELIAKQHEWIQQRRSHRRHLVLIKSISQDNQSQLIIVYIELQKKYICMNECFCCFDRNYEKYDFCMELPIGLSIKPIKKHKG